MLTYTTSEKKLSYFLDDQDNSEVKNPTIKGKNEILGQNASSEKNEDNKSNHCPIVLKDYSETQSSKYLILEKL